MTATVASHAYWVTEKGRGELRPTPLPETAPPGHLRVRAHYTGISAGTERLVGTGLVPPRMHERMRCPGMQGSFSFPAMYGYCLVGEVVAGTRAGERVFALHPHQSIADVHEDFIVALPDDVPDRRAILYANLETAINGVWDARLEEDERVLLLGLGTVGALLAARLVQLGIACTVCDADEAHREVLAKALPWLPAPVAPEDVHDASFDAVLHTTGAPAGLATALRALDVEGRVIELSWFGDRDVTLRLGEDFHDRRLTIRSSQVAHVSPEHTREERRGAVLELLARGDLLEPLIGPDVPFEELPTRMRAIYDGARAFPITAVRY